MKTIKLFAAICSIVLASWQRTYQSVTVATSASWVRIALVATLLILAGCDGLGTAQTTPTPTATATATQTPTETPTATPTPHPKDWNQERKYRWFAQQYYNLTSEKINSHNISVEDETLNFTYVKKNPNNKTKSRYEDAVMLTYYSSLIADDLTEKSHLVDRSWAPEHLKVTSIAPNGEVYWRSHTNSTNAMKYENDEITYTRYYFAYLNAAELGPAYSAYND